MALLRIGCRIRKHHDIAPENKSSHLYIFVKENWLETIMKENLSSIVAPPKKLLPKNHTLNVKMSISFGLGPVVILGEKKQVEGVSTQVEGYIRYIPFQGTGSQHWPPPSLFPPLYGCVLHDGHPRQRRPRGRRWPWGQHLLRLEGLSIISSPKPFEGHLNT